jgi:6-pyruvoyl-tetrahydropterin synthase
MKPDEIKQWGEQETDIVLRGDQTSHYDHHYLIDDADYDRWTASLLARAIDDGVKPLFPEASCPT